MNAPCYNCSKRSFGCHGRCEEYMKYDAENKKRLAYNQEYIRSNPDYMPNNFQKRKMDRVLKNQKRGKKTI